MKLYRVAVTASTQSMQTKPFHISRRRLAAWYTCVMTLILLLSGFTIYRLIVHARWLHLMKEVQSTVTTVKEQIGPALKVPGQIDPSLGSRLPGLCLADAPCSLLANTLPASVQAELEILLSQLKDKEYCLRLFNLDRQPIASIQIPYNNLTCQDPNFWRTLRDQQGNAYHNSFYSLRTTSNLHWGRLQIARSLNDLDIYLLRVEIALAAIILLSIGLVGCSSWWLAGLAMRPVHHSYQQMQQFTADAAHELRTPLAALRAIVQAALRSDDLSPQEVQETLTTINRQSQRLTRLVQDLLILCQIDQKSSSVPFSKCHLDLIIKELIDEFMALALAAGVKLSCDVPSRSSIAVKGNSEQLCRALSNLLSNAIQYTPAGGGVEIVLACDLTDAIIMVKDTGVGITSEEQTKIFDRFYRVDRERSRHRGGSGLGLAITQAIVHAHEGTLSVESEVGKGSVFTLRLPLAQNS